MTQTKILAYVLHCLKTRWPVIPIWALIFYLRIQTKGTLLNETEIGIFSLVAILFCPTLKQLQNRGANL